MARQLKIGRGLLSLRGGMTNANTPRAEIVNNGLNFDDSVVAVMVKGMRGKRPSDGASLWFGPL